METAGLLLLAAAYAWVNGINDGGSLAGAAIHGSRVRPLAAIGALIGALIVVPLTFGAPVAETLASRLVDFDAGAGTLGLVVGVLVAVAVVAVLAWLGLPTSLTLATVGAFVGVGLGSDLAVDGREVLRVLVLAVAAPVIGALGAYALMGLARLSWVSRHARAGGRARTVSATLVALAYAANDGQKMIAVAVVALGARAGAAGRPGLVLLVALAAVFALGAVAGIRRAGVTLGHGVLAARPTHLAASEMSAAGAVAATGALGAPVSMTQSLAGSLAGSGVTEGALRVRWRIAARLVLAWVVTFPLALLGAGAAAVVVLGTFGGGGR